MGNDSYVYNLSEDKTTNRTPILLVLILILQNLSIFFYDIVKAITSIQLLCLFLYILAMLLLRRNLHRQRYLMGWFLFTIIVIFNYLIGGDGAFIITFVTNTLLLFVMLSLPELRKLEFSILKLFSGVHLVASILVYILPQAISNPVIQILLKDSYSSNYSWRVMSHLNAGITSQPGVNAMYLTVFVLVCAVEIIVKSKKKIINYFLLVAAYAMIFTTAKRTAILITIIAIALFWILVNKNLLHKVNTNTIIKSAIFIVIGVLVARYIYTSTNILSSVLEKISLVSSMGDTSNGRIELWKKALEEFYNSPIWGVGLKSIYKQIGFDVHNTYLQILAETGIIGFIVFLIGIGSIFSRSYKNVSFVLVNEQDEKEKCAVGTGFVLMIFFLIYGFLGNTFIDYLPLMLFVISVYMTFSY